MNRGLFWAGMVCVVMVQVGMVWGQAVEAEPVVGAVGVGSGSGSGMSVAGEMQSSTVNGEVKAKPVAPLLPEGYMVGGRQAKLVKLDGDTRWFLVFRDVSGSDSPVEELNELLLAAQDTKAKETEKVSEPSPFMTPLEVLPSKWLTTMTQVMGERVKMDIDFRVWGEMTVYHGRNFVMPTKVLELTMFGDRGKPKQQKMPKKDLLAQTFGVKSPAEEESSGEKSVKEQDKLPEQLREALMGLPRIRPLELTEDQSEQFERKLPKVRKTVSTGTQTQQADWKDGYMIIDRIGRLNYSTEEECWFFDFESDGASLAEPPVRLQPNRLLEEMEKHYKDSLGGVKFRVSGIISKYQGMSYMLLRKVLVAYEMGNLGK